MRSSAALVVSVFAAGISAQANYTLPADFNAGLVSSTEKAQWCTGQRNICPEICGGSANTNECDATTLSFSCVCADGTVPDSSEYISSLPFYVCQANFGQCVTNHPNDADGQEKCKQEAQCGTKNATASTSTSSAAATTTAATTTSSAATDSSVASTTAATSKVSATSAAATTKAKSSSAAVVKAVQDYSTVLLAGGLLAVFQFVL